MKQILQNLGNGETIVEDVPAPPVRPGHLLVATEVSLVSAGTERMLVDFGKANLISKARQQPDKVRQVLDKVRTDGVAPTLEAVRAKLEQLIPMGYSNVGRVIGVGAGVEGFEVGDRVISNGSHAEIVSVPKNLCARIPDGVSSETAAFTVLSAIGLQGVRLAQPTLGEAVAVTGLGLIGLLTAQLLRANGCRVLGLDPNPDRVALAQTMGVQAFCIGPNADPVAAAMAFSRGRGVDAVIVTAATQSNEPMRQAAQMCRKRGRIVLVGVAGLELSRADFFEKELSFQVSCSYGPGRYDPLYESGGQDYPVGFVRWTEQRNFEAALDMMAAGAIDVSALLTHRFKLSEAPQAYAALDDRAALGILLDYGAAAEEAEARTRRTIELSRKQIIGGGIAFIGAGNYATRMLMPAFAAAGAELAGVATANGVSAVAAGRKFSIPSVGTDIDALLAGPGVGAVVIATPHNSHARYTLAALERGIGVFVEKPLCLTLPELDSIVEAYAKADVPLMVGFNRRFAPLVSTVRGALTSGPKSVVLTMNAGAIPFDHWIQDPAVGGGRIVGEACHYVDLARFLVGHPIVAASAHAMASADGRPSLGDTATLSLTFADGSIASINYFANGSKAFPKERIEVFDAGAVYAIDNFRTLRTWNARVGSRRTWSQDKGQRICVQAFVDAVKQNRQAPIAADEIFEVSRWTIGLAETVRRGGGEVAL